MGKMCMSMEGQLDLFSSVGKTCDALIHLPEGFRYQAELLGPAEEKLLLAQVLGLSFREFEFHGYTGKRRVVSFGWQYDFSSRVLRKADDMPDFLRAARVPAAAFAG